MERLELRLSDGKHEFGAVWMRPTEARFTYVFAHGAGAPMTHPWMEAMSACLSEVRIATLRYNFPYIEQGRGPDRPPAVIAVVRAAVAKAAELAPELSLFAGGKSFGGRMTSTAQSEEPLVGVHGLVFFGFPLHPPKVPGTSRADNLFNIAIP